MKPKQWKQAFIKAAIRAYKKLLRDTHHLGLINASEVAMKRELHKGVCNYKEEKYSVRNKSWEDIFGRYNPRYENPFMYRHYYMDFIHYWLQFEQINYPHFWIYPLESNMITSKKEFNDNILTRIYILENELYSNV